MTNLRLRLGAVAMSALVVALAATTAVLAHGGGVDAQGGHNDRKAGNYHFHKGSFAGETFGSKSEATAALQKAGSGATSQPSKAAMSLSDYSSDDKIDALIELLVRKGVIAQRDLEAELRGQE